MRYTVGQRWRVQRDKGSFDFVVVAHAGTGKKLCRIVCLEPECNHKRCHSGVQQVYTHKHLKKYAVLFQDPES